MGTRLDAGAGPDPTLAPPAGLAAAGDPPARGAGDPAAGDPRAGDPGAGREAAGGADVGPPPVVSARGRAIWGLVDDGYGLVASTPGLAAAEAEALGGAVAIGNPATDVEDAIAFLRDPALGWLCARAFTDARRDSHGRGVLVTDVVALAPEAMRALRHDPFRSIPRARRDRRPEREGVGALDLPALAPMSEAGEARALAAALARPEADAVLPTLLAALLAGDGVLWTGEAPPAALLQAAALLLPPGLRGALTFQTLAVQLPRLAPRLTVAPRLSAALAEGGWTSRLPERAETLPAAAREAADALLALARAGSRAEAGAAAVAGVPTAPPPDAGPTPLQAAHARWTRCAALGGTVDVLESPAALGDEVWRMLRLAAVDRAARAGDGVAAIRALGTDPSPGERTLAAESLAACPPDALAAGVAARLADGGAVGAAAVAEALAALASVDDGADMARLRAVLDRLTGHEEDAGERLRAVLAHAAARLDDAAGTLRWAGPGADWPWLADRLGRAPAADVAPRLRPLVHALALSGDARPLVAALSGVAAAAPPAARDAESLALAAARRWLRADPATGAPAAVAGLGEGLRALWTAARPGVESRPFAVLLGAASAPADVTAPEAAAAAVAAIRAGRPGERADAPGREVAGWLAVLVGEVLGGAASGAAASGGPASGAAASGAAASGAVAPTATTAAARAGAGRRGGREAAVRAALGAAGALVDAAAAAGIAGASAALGALLRDSLPDGPPPDADAAVTAAWEALLARADGAGRGELALRALLGAAARVPDDAAGFATACAAAARAGVVLDDAALQRLGDALAEGAVRCTGAAEGAGALRADAAALELALAALGALADGPRAAALAQRVLARAHPALRDALRLRRLALAVAEVERGRDERTYGELCALLRARGVALRPADEMLLRVYLGVPADPWPARARAAVARLFGRPA